MDLDTQLVAAALGGDGEAFNRIVSRYADRVYGLALSYVKDFDLAADVSQEVFLRAFLRLHQLEDPQHLAPWLSSITANVCRMSLRASRDTIPIEQIGDGLPQGSSPAPDRPDEAVERESTRKFVLKALSRLSEANRQAVSLYYIDGLRTPEIASFLRTSPTAVRQRLSRARQQLQKEVLAMVQNTLYEEAPGEHFRATIERLLEQARVHFTRSDYRVAVEPLEQAHELVPEDALVALLLADAYTMGRTADEVIRDRSTFDKAGEVLRKAVARHPENVQLRAQLAQHNATFGKFVEIEREHHELLDLAAGTPYEPWAVLRMARVYAPRRKHHEAIRYYNRLIDLEPRLSGIAHFEMGISFFLEEDYPQGIAVLQESISAFQDLKPNALQKLTEQVFGSAYVRFAERFDETSSWQASAHVWLAGLHGKLGQTEEAKRQLSAAVQCLSAIPQPARGRCAGHLLRSISDRFGELAGDDHLRQLERLSA